MNGLLAQKYDVDAFYSEEYKLNNLELLDSNLSTYRVFLTGENHRYYNFNNKLELQLLQYLHAHRGVRDLVIELGFVRGYLIDQYINGDSTYYDQLVRTTGYSYLEFYKELRSWNQTLPDSMKVHVHGVDIERFPDDAPVLMARILEKDSMVPESISFLREIIRSYAEFKQSESRANEFRTYSFGGYLYRSASLSDEKTIDSILVNYELLRNDFKNYLGTDFLLFDKAMTSLKDYMLYESYERTPQQFIYRERFLLKNMTALLDSDSNRAVFGQFGRCHVGFDQVKDDCDWWENSPMAKRLNDSKYKGQVMNIAIYYESDYDYSEEMIKRKYKALMDGKSTMLFKIDSEDSLLASNYQYLIFHSTDLAYNNVPEDKMKNPFFASIDVGFGISMFNFDNLNTAINPVSKKAFNSNVRTYELGFITKSDGVNAGFMFRLFQTQKYDNGRYTYKLGGYSVYEVIGLTPTISKHFAPTFYGMLGYSRLSLNVRDDSSNMQLSPAFSPIKSAQYNNGTFLLGAGLDLRIAIGPWLALTFKSHIMADISNTYWRQAVPGINPLDKSSPKTSLYNYGLSAGLSIMTY
ncbi:MAG: erythromycin esterase family protein [Bacteroidetes bacterium]|nr:erythromycin esterase family protein [Bacteroidota bacterium]